VATKKASSLDDRIKALTAKKERLDKATQLKQQIQKSRDELKKLRSKK
jgi:hypothetical protein